MRFCTTMHVASGRVRRKTSSLCYQNPVFTEKFQLTEPTTVNIA